MLPPNGKILSNGAALWSLHILPEDIKGPKFPKQEPRLSADRYPNPLWLEGYLEDSDWVRPSCWTNSGNHLGQIQRGFILAPGFRGFTL